MDWQELDAHPFEEAAREDRLVLLSVGAVWCHWCHVMDEETWADPAVEQLVREHFVAVRVDQDNRPDVSQRYEDWGWPATVILDAHGAELAKLRGYLPPGRMAAILTAFVADPTPGPSAIGEAVAGSSGLDRAALLARWDSGWDEAEGGWGLVTKALDGPSVELAMALGDPLRTDRARRTVTLERKLVDPVWGGTWQYSDSGDWDHPHFEKIVPMQAADLSAFALAYARWGDPADRAAALAIARYVDAFLWDPAGGYRASQDADLVPGEPAGAYFALDDAGRRARGIPRIDPHRYARENGLLARALADAAGWLGEPALLADAERAAEWAIAARSLPGGGFRHDAHDDGGPWLADTLAMAEACAALATATGDPRWLARAEDALAFVDRTFRAPDGFRASAGEPIPGLPPLLHREENARLAGLADLVGEATGDPRWAEVARHAGAYVAGVAGDGPAAPALLAELALAGDALHVRVVGPDGPLLGAARALPVVERVISSEGGPAVATAYACVGGACAAPVTRPEDLRATVDRLTAR